MEHMTGHFRYGINPGQVATFDGLANVHTSGTRPLSFNAFADLQLGVSMLAEAGPEPYRLVYVKHKMPVIAAAEHTEHAAIRVFLELARQTGNAEFGCVVSNFTLSDDALPLLDQLRIHTLAAKGFAPSVTRQMESEAVQRANRGLVAVSIKGPLCAIKTQVTLEGGATVTHDERVEGPVVNRSVMMVNELWAEPRNFALGLAALRHARTIAACVLTDGAVKLVRCGYYDGCDALESTIEVALAQGIELRNAVVLTDGCFGVKSPTRLVRQRVGAFVFCGGAQNDDALLVELCDAGIGALCTKARYFFY